MLETTAEGEAVRILGEIDMANATDFENCIARAATPASLSSATYANRRARLSVLERRPVPKSHPRSHGGRELRLGTEVRAQFVGP